MKILIYKKIVFLISLLFVTSLIAQPMGRRGDEIPRSLPVQIETHIQPSDTSYTCVIIFKAAYNNLLFPLK